MAPSARFSLVCGRGWVARPLHRACSGRSSAAIGWRRPNFTKLATRAGGRDVVSEVAGLAPRERILRGTEMVQAGKLKEGVQILETLVGQDGVKLTKEELTAT